MSEHERGNLPRSKTRKAALAGGPDRNSHLIEDLQNSEATLARQALRLAGRFGLTVELASTIAQLAYAAGPR